MKIDVFEKPFLIMGEGHKDAQFFRNLIRLRGLPDKFHVMTPGDVPDINGNGKTRFSEALNGIPIIPGFSSLQGIIIVADNDMDPIGSFESVRTQIMGTVRKHPAAAQPLEKTDGTPPIIVMMIPWVGQVGNLETLCCRLHELRNRLLRVAWRDCSNVRILPRNGK